MSSPRPFLRKAASLIVSMCLGTGTALFANACAQEEESLIVIGMPVFLDPDSNDIAAVGCGAQAGGSDFIRGMGLDYSFNTGLTLPFELHNNILSVSGDVSNAGIDPSEVQLLSVDVTVDFPQLPQVVAELKAANPRYVEFNLPFPTDSFPGGSNLVVFVEIPETVIARHAQAVANANLAPGTLVVSNFTFQFKAKRTSGTVGEIGKITSRSYTVPIKAGFGILRSCLSTPWVDEETGTTYELCSPNNCASPQVYRNNVCGNAQWAAQLPRCCDGGENWAEILNAPAQCGVE
jgi:hypothetical protein